MCMANRFGLLFITLFLINCGGGGGSSASGSSTGSSGTGDASLGLGGTASAITDISSLPLITDAVAAAGTSGTPLLMAAAATTGLPFATAASDDYGNTFTSYLGASDVGSSYFSGGSSTGSYAACEMLNYARGAYAQAASADQIMCLIKQGVGTLSSDDFQVRSMSFTEGSETMTYKMKFRQITDETTGGIKAFEMYGCSNDNAAGEMRQDLYFSQDYSGGNVVMVLKGDTEPGNPQVDEVSYQVDVTGDSVNSSGQITGSKSVLMRYQNLFADGTNNHAVTDMTLTDSYFRYNGFSCDKATLGSSSCDAHGGSSGYAIFASMDILNHNSPGENNLNRFALGNGAAYLYRPGESIEGIQIWNADTGNLDNADTTQSHYIYIRDNQASAKAIDPDYTAVSFTEAQTWDCSDTAEALTVDDTVLTGCFGEREINQDVHLECGGGPGGANLSTSTVTP